MAPFDVLHQQFSCQHGLIFVLHVIICDNQNIFLVSKVQNVTLVFEFSDLIKFFDATLKYLVKIFDGSNLSEVEL